MPINIKFPLEDDVMTSRFLKSNTITKDALTSNLLLLLLTNKGERYYMPDYGTNLKKFIFEQNDSTTEIDIEEDIKNTIKKYIPELTVTNVTFYRGEDENQEKIDDNHIQVLVDFIYSDNVFAEAEQVRITF